MLLSMGEVLFIDEQEGQVVQYNRQVFRTRDATIIILELEDGGFYLCEMQIAALVAMSQWETQLHFELHEAGLQFREFVLLSQLVEAGIQGDMCEEGLQQRQDEFVLVLLGQEVVDQLVKLDDEFLVELVG